MNKIKNKFRKKGIPLFDLHTHSINKYTNTFTPNKCWNPEKEFGPKIGVVEAAIDFGLDFVGISDHSPHMIPYPGLNKKTQINSLYEDGSSRYIKFMKNIKKKYLKKFVSGMEILLTDINQLFYLPVKTLKKLDYLIIENHEQEIDFKKVRKFFGKEIKLILAHCPLDLMVENNTTTINRFIEDLLENKIMFELSRQHIARYMENKKNFYSTFFRLAKEKNLKFTFGSDYHLKPGNYSKFFGNIFGLIEKYNLNKNNFISIKDLI